MPFQTNAGIRFYQFPHLGLGITHAIFTRQGGTSTSYWASLNMGGTVGDDPNRVKENRQRALAALGKDPDSFFDVWQVHGAHTVLATGPRLPEVPHQKADIILTNTPGVTLLMRFADCVPILLHDPVKKVIGIVHAGWQGTVLGTAKVAVEAMQSRFGTQPVDILAAIGPSIGPDHYQVGPDVVARVRDAFSEDSSTLLNDKSDSSYFDLWAANRLILERAGVAQIDLAEICTACHVHDWYSHRAEHGQTGRFGAIIALESYNSGENDER
jgi:polyphenol oxidase